jgi:hypothetical protein
MFLKKMEETPMRYGNRPYPKIGVAVLAGCFLCMGLPARAQFGGLAKQLEGAAGNSSLPDSKIAAGLKQALQIGTDKAVSLTGRPGGYSSNPAIRIGLPGNMRLLEGGLKAMGYGPKLDAFTASMNQAAESAAPAAKSIFADAIASMSFADARKILQGGDTSATDYFKQKTSAQLAAAFRPAVEKAMSANDVTKQYDELTSKAQSMPFMQSHSLDINSYVVSKALDGLFYTLGQQEKQIRTDPAARTTSLLKQVFGHS